VSAPFRFSLSRRASRQIAAAIEWWAENRRKADRDAIPKAIDHAKTVLEAHPDAGPAGPNGLRRLVLTDVDYRYVLSYRVRPRARRIEVVAFHHGSRDRR
jgi:plasmid stabilization system protein ParE